MEEPKARCHCTLEEQNTEKGKCWKKPADGYLTSDPNCERCKGSGFLTISMGKDLTSEITEEELSQYDPIFRIVRKIMFQIELELGTEIIFADIFFVDLGTYFYGEEGAKHIENVANSLIDYYGLTGHYKSILQGLCEDEKIFTIAGWLAIECCQFTKDKD